MDSKTNKPKAVRSTSRALIFNRKKQVYLVTHNYTQPKNDGK